MRPSTNNCERCGVAITATISQRLYCVDCKRAVVVEANCYRDALLCNEENPALTEGEVRDGYARSVKRAFTPRGSISAKQDPGTSPSVSATVTATHFWKVIL